MDEPVPDRTDIERTLCILIMLEQGDEVVITRVYQGLYGPLTPGVLGKLVSDSLEYLAKEGYVAPVGTIERKTPKSEGRIGNFKWETFIVFEPTEKAWKHLSPKDRKEVFRLSPLAKKMAEDGYSFLDTMPEAGDDEIQNQDF